MLSGSSSIPKVGRVRCELVWMCSVCFVSNVSNSMPKIGRERCGIFRTSAQRIELNSIDWKSTMRARVGVSVLFCAQRSSSTPDTGGEWCGLSGMSFGPSGSSSIPRVGRERCGMFGVSFRGWSWWLVACQLAKINYHPLGQMKADFRPSVSTSIRVNVVMCANMCGHSSSLWSTNKDDSSKKTTPVCSLLNWCILNRSVGRFG